MSILSDDAFVRLFQERNGLKVDGWAGLETVAKLEEIAPLKPWAEVPALPADYWPMLSKIESSDKPYAQAPTSSASGLFQFIKATWIGEGGAWGPTLRPAFGGLKPSPAEQLERAKTFTQKNALYLMKAGVSINRATLYAAHFLGPVTAGAILAADVKARADTIAGEAATAANESILRGKTVAQFMAWLHGKTGAWAR